MKALLISGVKKGVEGIAAIVVCWGFIAAVYGVFYGGYVLVTRIFSGNKKKLMDAINQMTPEQAAAAAQAGAPGPIPGEYIHVVGQ